jgi:hypothetical protein
MRMNLPAFSGAIGAEGGLYPVLSGRGGDHGAHARTQGLRPFQVHSLHTWTKYL